MGSVERGAPRRKTAFARDKRRSPVSMGVNRRAGRIESAAFDADAMRTAYDRSSHNHAEYARSVFRARRDLRRGNSAYEALRQGFAIAEWANACLTPPA